MRVNDEGLPCGECFVAFATEENVLAALERNRYVDAWLATLHGWGLRT